MQKPHQINKETLTWIVGVFSPGPHDEIQLWYTKGVGESKVGKSLRLDKSNIKRDILLLHWWVWGS